MKKNLNLTSEADLICLPEVYVFFLLNTCIYDLYWTSGDF